MWRYMALFTNRYIDVFARLKHWLSDYMRQDMDCKVVLLLLTYLRMFSPVYFVLKLLLMWRRWSVQMRYTLPCLFNWGATAICHSRLNRTKTAFIVLILQYNGQNLKSETLFILKKERKKERKSFIAKCVCTHKKFVLCLELPVQKQYSTNRQQCKQRQHIIKVIKNTNNEENRQ